MLTRKTREISWKRWGIGGFLVLSVSYAAVYFSGSIAALNELGEVANGGIALGAGLCGSFLSAGMAKLKEYRQGRWHQTADETSPIVSSPVVSSPSINSHSSNVVVCSILGLGIQRNYKTFNDSSEKNHGDECNQLMDEFMGYVAQGELDKINIFFEKAEKLKQTYCKQYPNHRTSYLIQLKTMGYQYEEEPIQMIQPYLASLTSHSPMDSMVPLDRQFIINQQETSLSSSDEEDGDLTFKMSI